MSRPEIVRLEFELYSRDGLWVHDRRLPMLGAPRSCLQPSQV